MKDSISIRSILVKMLENHEFELTPVHTPISEYESVEQAESDLLQLLDSKAEWLNVAYEPNDPNSTNHTMKAIPISALNELRSK